MNCKYEADIGQPKEKDLTKGVVEGLNLKIEENETDAAVITYSVSELLLSFLPQLLENITQSEVHKGKVIARVKELRQLLTRLNSETEKMVDVDFVPSVVKKFDIWYRLIPKGWIREYIKEKVIYEQVRMFTIYHLAIKNYLQNNKYADNASIKSQLLAVATYCGFAVKYEDKAKENVRIIHRAVGSNAPVHNSNRCAMLRDIADKCNFILDLMAPLPKERESQFAKTMFLSGNNLINKIKGAGYRQRFDYIIANRQLAFQYLFFFSAACDFKMLKKMEPMKKEAFKQFDYYRHHPIEVISELRRIGALDIVNETIEPKQYEARKQMNEVAKRILDAMTELELPHLTAIQHEAFHVMNDREEKTFKHIWVEFINSTEIINN